VDDATAIIIVLGLSGQLWEKGLGLNDSEGLPPIEPTTEPNHDEAGGIRRTPRLHVALLIQS